jgi:hypothetical protein
MNYVYHADMNSYDLMSCSANYVYLLNGSAWLYEKVVGGHPKRINSIVALAS